MSKYVIQAYRSMEAKLHFIEVGLLLRLGGWMRWTVQRCEGRSNDSLLALSMCTLSMYPNIHWFSAFNFLRTHHCGRDVCFNNGKSRTRNMRKYLFSATSVVIGCSHHWAFWADGVASLTHKQWVERSEWGGNGKSWDHPSWSARKITSFAAVCPHQFDER